jgi:hypothetical protein
MMKVSELLSLLDTARREADVYVIIEAVDDDGEPMQVEVPLEGAEINADGDVVLE